MTLELFREDAYRQECSARVVAVSDNALVLDQTVFYPLGGGQPGDTGVIEWGDEGIEIIDTRYDDHSDISHVVSPDGKLPPEGQQVTARIDWDRRYRHMRMHTALHLLGAVLPYGVTGGNISAAKSRLDFDMEDTVDKQQVLGAIQRLVDENHTVSCRWISDAELEEQPELVRTMSVQPPKGKGKVRLLEIEGVDLQPCGGTHVAATAEIGRVRIGKVEKKGQRNRRVNLHLDD